MDQQKSDLIDGSISKNANNNSGVNADTENSESCDHSAKIEIQPKIDSSLNLDNSQIDSIASIRDEGSVNNKHKKSNFIKNVVLVVLIIVVIVMVWNFADLNRKNEGKIEENKVKITVSDIKEGGNVNIVNSTGTVVAGKNLANAEVFGDKVKITAYFGNSQYNKDVKDCSLVYPLERFIDNKYDSMEINTVKGLLEPLTDEEKAEGYYSSIPEGTILKQLKINGDTAEVSFSGKIGQMGGSCAVSAVRSQIEKTLKQFPDIKKVNICIDGNCNQDEILQP